MRTLVALLFGALLSGCVILPKDRALAKNVLDTHGAIKEVAGAKKALATVFDDTAAMTEDVKSELNGAEKELGYANGYFYLKAIPFVAAGESQHENAAKALQESLKHASAANAHVEKAESALKEQVK